MSLQFWLGCRISSSHLMGAHDEFQGDSAGMRQVSAPAALPGQNLHVFPSQGRTALTGMHGLLSTGDFAHVCHHPACQPNDLLQAGVCCLWALGRRAWILHDLHEDCSP